MLALLRQLGSNKKAAVKPARLRGKMGTAKSSQVRPEYCKAIPTVDAAGLISIAMAKPRMTGVVSKRPFLSSPSLLRFSLTR